MRVFSFIAVFASVLLQTAAADTPSYRSAVIDLHRNLVVTSSLSGNENAVGSFLVDYLTSKGFQTFQQPVQPLENTPDGEPRFNVVAWKGSDLKTPRVMVTSHFDVVPPHIEYEIEDGEISSETMIKGRGTVDAKGSVASMIIAVERLLSERSISDEAVMFLFVAGEEIGGDGMRTFSAMPEEDRATLPTFNAAIFGEPTETKLACGHKGGMFCELTAHGVSGHSSYPWLAKSANEVIIRALKELMDTDLGSSERYGNTTVNVGKIVGGVASNVIAEKAVAGLMVRVAIGPEKEGSEIVEKRMLDSVHKVDKTLELTCQPGYGFISTNCEVDGFETVVVNYGTDIANLEGDYVRYLYGPGSIFVAHGASENLTVGDLETAVEGYQRIIIHALDNDMSEL